MIGEALGKGIEQRAQDIIRVMQCERGRFERSLMLKSGDQRIRELQWLGSLNYRGSNSMGIGVQFSEVSLNSNKGRGRQRVGRIHLETSQFPIPLVSLTTLSGET